MPDPGRCLAVTVRSQDTLAGEDVSTARDYDETALHVLKAGHTTVNLLDVIDEELRKCFADPASYILLDDDEIDHDGLQDIGQCSDDALNDEEAYVRFVRKLAGQGILIYRRRRKSAIGIFVVDKRGVEIRLVLDCRVTNAL